MAHCSDGLPGRLPYNRAVWSLNGALLAQNREDAVRVLERHAGQSLPGRWKTLAPGQQQVVFLTGRNLSPEEIAGRLRIREDTVKSHQINAMKKLGMRGKYRLKQAFEGFDFTW